MAPTLDEYKCILDQPFDQKSVILVSRKPYRGNDIGKETKEKWDRWPPFNLFRRKNEEVFKSMGLGGLCQYIRVGCLWHYPLAPPR
ncbi:hypothetical protein CR513_22864, partial [Mucuna pruriens]